MSNGAFLLLAVGLSIVGSLLIWLFNRKPKTFMSSIDDFSREMKALGHEADRPGSARRRKRSTPPSGRGPASPEADHPEDDWSSDPTEERRS